MTERSCPKVSAKAAQLGPEPKTTTPTATLTNVITTPKSFKLTELVIHAQRVMSQMSTWLTATRLALSAMVTPPRVEMSARSAQCTPNPKATTATAAQISAMIKKSFYQTVHAKNVMKAQSQISFGEENALLQRETKSAMTDKLS